MVARVSCFLFAIFFLGIQPLGVEAQTSSASFQFPIQDGLTINLIDTIILQWTSNYDEAYLLMWCQNGTAGNNVVLGSSFQVQPVGSFGYVLSKNDPSQSAFPVACHAQLLPTPAGSGVDSPVGITFTSSPGLQAKTVSLATSSTSQTPVTTSTPASSGISASSTVSTPATTSKSSEAGNTSKITSPPSTTTSNPPSTGSSGGSSSSASTAATASNTATASANTNNTGAIVGGVIGGLGLLCFIVFGSLILRKIQRNEKEDSKPKRARSWWRFHQVTAMQTDGLHEKDGTPFSRYEKDGNQRFEKEGSTPVRYEKAGDMPKRATAIELPAETVIREA
ncbi:hypothetical protein EG329_010842 [Mollisiaceae sp. DMI_Dod_QoI]|nr:hypothetical protein EG329_010842 [Helotiales sp. DMI_Dod_QoI]